MELTIIQQLILGLIQGVFEWLPISSSAFTILVMSNFYDITDLGFLLQAALFLHLGTFFAALIYFRKDVIQLTKTLFHYKDADEKTKKVLNFLIIATIISGIIGLVVLFALDQYEETLEFTGKSIAFIIGVLLLLTGTIQLKVREKGLRKESDIDYHDSVVLGITQGLASLPGLSRSGMTVSTLLLKKFDDTTALKLSFLMSLPIVLIANIFLNLTDFTFTLASLYGLVASFTLGLLTIDGLMKLSKKINFGWFILIFAMLMLVSLFFV